MASPRGLAFPAAVALAATVTWYVWTNQGQAHGVALEQEAYSPDSYDCYAWWSHHRAQGFIRHFPREMGPNCLPTPLQNQDGALSTSPRNNEESPYG